MKALAAARSTFRAALMYAKIMPSNAIASAKASVGLCSPKNSMDHFALVASCEIHSRNACLRSRDGAALHTRHPDQTIVAQSTVQTTGYTFSGGAKLGLFRC